MKDFKEPLLIALVLFVLVGLAYSPLKNATSSKSGSVKGVNSTIGNAGNYQNTSSQYSAEKTIAEEIKNAERIAQNLEKDLENKIDESNRSPYYGKVSMSHITGLYNSDPDREYITLSTNLAKTETIKVTGWYLKSEVTGYYVFIGKAALLPFPFTKTESDVYLQRGDKVYMIKGFSPIGISFRTNKCTGYFEENRTFVPGLSLRCPLPIDEKLPTFSNDYDRDDECLKLIERIPRCTTRDSEYIRDLPDTVTDSCKNYITGQVNYNTCVALHFGDTDFPGQEYYIYLNKFGPLWRERSDKINLRDQNGLIVDTISY